MSVIRGRWMFRMAVALGLAAGCTQLVLGSERTLDEGTGTGGAGANGAGGEAAAGAGGAGGAGWKCDPGSDVVWLRRFGGASYNHFASVAPDGEGGLYVSGWFAGAIDLGAGPMLSKGDRDMFVARLDGDGELLWAKPYGTPLRDEIGPTVIAHPDGVLLAGTNFTQLDLGAGSHSSMDGDAYVALVSPAGVLIWDHWLEAPGEQRSWGDPAVDPGTGDVIVTYLFKGDVQVGSEIYSEQGGSGDILVLRLAAEDGSLVGQRAFGTPQTEHPEGVAVLPSGRIALAGWTAGDLDFGEGPQIHDDSDAFVALLSPDLSTTLWGRLFSSAGHQNGMAVAARPEGGLVLAGIMFQAIDLGTGDLGDTPGGFVTNLTELDGSPVLSIPMPGFSEPRHLLQGPGGEIFLAGNYQGVMTFGGNSKATPSRIYTVGDPVAVKITGDLQFAWKQLASTSPIFETMTGVALGDDDTLFLSGSFAETLTIDGCPPQTSAGDEDAFLLKRKR